ncbi:hypothetical protein SBA4_40020 [Candidatus Sulfopaludibacter sp. SbA4]|nr:hypothetical protein SBA4_40020 [Candidatus Sulfopaludibacter sp. SbA4]
METTTAMRKAWPGETLSGKIAMVNADQVRQSSCHPQRTDTRYQQGCLGQIHSGSADRSG